MSPSFDIALSAKSLRDEQTSLKIRNEEFILSLVREVKGYHHDRTKKEMRFVKI